MCIKISSEFSLSLCFSLNFFHNGCSLLSTTVALSIGKLAGLVKKMALKVIRQREIVFAAEASDPAPNAVIAVGPLPVPLPPPASIVAPLAGLTETIPVYPAYTELFRRSGSITSSSEFLIEPKNSKF